MGAPVKKQNAQSDLEAFGAPSELISEVAANSEPEVFEVLEENWESVKFFLRLTTQWHCSQHVVIGLNYQSVQFLMDVFKVEDREAVLTDLQCMEIEALKIMNKKD